MASAIRYTGDNVREVSEFITPEPHSPYELKGGVWIKLRLNASQMRAEYPEYLNG